jgi:hypothetical protein
VLRWRNTTKKRAKELWFHLYLNAFSNNQTTLMAALPKMTERWARRFPGEWGRIDVTRIRIGDEDLSDRLEFVQPDDANPYDRTVARLPLKRSVRAGGSVEVEMDFVARLPRVFMRAGHAAPFFLVAQWYPKIGVFEGGEWACHQYHATTEFYGDFGAYEVNITLPEEYVLGHTGVVVDKRDNEDGTKTIGVRADDVQDFAWAADPRFQLTEGEQDETKIRLLMQPENVHQASRYLNALRATMSRYREWFGPYPYPVITMIDVGAGAFAAGMMEYPMLFTTTTAWWMPTGVRLPEFVAVHEFGHQYWYGMVANDESKAAWLDEGLNSYVEGLIMASLHGSETSYLDWLGLRLDAVAKHRLLYLAAPIQDRITKPGRAMLNPRSYFGVSYAKTALILHTLDRQLGSDRVLGALGQYFRVWQFRHPTGEDWRASMRKALGTDFEPFLDETLDGTGVLDYAVTKVEVTEVPQPAGLGIEEQVGVGNPEEKRYRTRVLVERLGTVQMPVEIVVGFEDGSKTRDSWDGRDRWRRLEIVSHHRAEYAEVDPARRLPLDANFLNNSRMRSGGTRGIIRVAGRWGLWLQNGLHLLTGF